LVVLLASVLKPVDDTRMYGKFAQTLLERPYTQVHVAGRAAGAGAGLRPAHTPGARLTQHGIFWGSRMGLNRLAAQFRYWRLLRRLRPSVVVVHAPELLPLTLLWRAWCAGRQFVYDIRENYALNVTSQAVYRGLTRRILAAGLRWVESQAARRAAALTLAEASYASELPYLNQLPSSCVAVLENKYQPAATEVLAPAPRLPAAGQPLRLLYSGTISVLNGVWEAITLAQQLHSHWPGGVQLTVAGFCQQPELLLQLQAMAAQHTSWLRLVGGAEPVPHAHIVAEINNSHVGLLAYRPHPSTERCRPTKLFEYLAHGLPVLASPNPLWLEPMARYGAGLPLDFTQPLDAPALVTALQQTTFYPLGPPTDVLWAAEGKKLWRLLDSFV